jgi:hypothetical protein
MSWIETVVAQLCDYKREGIGFHTAWQRTLHKHPPLHRDQPPEVATLFSFIDDEDEPFLDAFYRYADDAWHGRRPEQDHVRALAEADVFPRAEAPQYQPRAGGSIAA